MDGCSRAAAVKRLGRRPVVLLIVGLALAALTTRACSKLGLWDHLAICKRPFKE